MHKQNFEVVFCSLNCIFPHCISLMRCESQIQERMTSRAKFQTLKFEFVFVKCGQLLKLQIKHAKAN